MKFLRGKDYPNVCAKCQKAIDDMADVFEMGLMHDTDDPEAPCMEVYDQGMYCGGHECKEHPAD